MAPSNKIEDCLFWYEAQQHADDFKIGKRQMWEFHYRMKKIRADENEEEDEYLNSLNGQSNVTRSTKISKLVT